MLNLVNGLIPWTRSTCFGFKSTPFPTFVSLWVRAVKGAGGFGCCSLTQGRFSAGLSHSSFDQRGRSPYSNQGLWKEDPIIQSWPFYFTFFLRVSCLWGGSDCAGNFQWRLFGWKERGRSWPWCLQCWLPRSGHMVLGRPALCKNNSYSLIFALS